VDLEIVQLVAQNIVRSIATFAHTPSLRYPNEGTVAALHELGMLVSTFRVLIVEDEPNARAALRDLLEDEGYLVTTASTGTAALAQQRAAPSDVVLADLGLPDLDGFAVAQLAQAETGCTVLVMTGNERARREDLGFAVIMKPIDVDDLLLQLLRAVAARPS
jgi:CheY-like chemotaxis protein